MCLHRMAGSWLFLFLCNAAIFLAAPARSQSVLFRRGDSNDDGQVDLADPIHALSFLFLGSDAPSCRDAADANDDGILDVSDAVHSLGFLFLGNPPLLAEPFFGCGLDRTPDLLSCASSHSACGRVEEAWAVRYDGPRNGFEFAGAVTLDPSGNVVITGRSEGAGGEMDYTSVKYGPDGRELWIARYDGPGKDRDVPKAVASDAAGNVYVTGSSKGLGTGSDFATVKYDAAGRELWVARYSGQGNGADFAEALALDPSGNVVITGRSEGAGGESDYTTVKYGPDGRELWIARYDGPGNGSDVPQAVASDAAGNVYVTGSSQGLGTGSDFATVKYDAAGSVLWVARYSGPYEGADEAAAIVVDPSGAIYVTGRSQMDSVRGLDILTVKYDSQGNLLWTALYDGANRERYDVLDTAAAMALDAGGSLYVTGSSEGEVVGLSPPVSTSDFVTLKYDPQGDLLWSARYSAPGLSFDESYSLAVNAAEEVYVAGRSVLPSTGSDFVTVKYDAEGQQIWAARHGEANALFDNPAALVLDAAGNVYVLGTSESPRGDLDFATVKFSPAGKGH